MNANTIWIAAHYHECQAADRQRWQMTAMNERDPGELYLPEIIAEGRPIPIVEQ